MRSFNDTRITGSLQRERTLVKRNTGNNVTEWMKEVGREESREVNEQVGRRGLGVNNLSDLFANQIAPLLKSVHLRISGAESRGHASGSSLDF